LTGHNHAQRGINMSHWKSAKFKGDNFEQGADGAFNVSIEVCYLDASYILERYEEPKTAPNGRLVIAELRPKEGTPPSFLLRWDEKANKLKVDIQGISSTLEKSFEQGTGGYAGHYPRRVQSEGKVFEVDIRMPEKHVFNGYVKFNIKHSATATVPYGINPSASINLDVHRNNAVPPA